MSIACGKDKIDQVTNVLDIGLFCTTSWISKEDWNIISKGNPTNIYLVSGKQRENEEDNVKENISFFTSLQGIDESKGEKCIEILWCLSRYDGEKVIPHYDGSNNEECLALLKSWARNGFSEDSIYRMIVEEAPEGTAVTQLTIRERFLRAELLQETTRRVVLVGDATHCMTMFRGECQK